MSEQTIPFAKMQGVGNDFVVVDNASIQELNPSAIAVQLCARHFGVGADGLLIVGSSPDPSAAFSYRMYNPDGTPDMCGNGMRCAVLYAVRSGLLRSDLSEFLVDTIDGPLAGNLISISEDLSEAQVKVELTTPRLTPAEIPFLAQGVRDMLIDVPIEIAGANLVATMVNTGSTHTVIFSKEPVADSQFEKISPLLENDPRFPERTSVMWANQTGPADFSIRIWERAAGETLGCGTGASAVAVAAILTGRARHGEVIAVKSKGGELTIEWPSPESHLTLTGPAVWVFDGAVAARRVYTMATQLKDKHAPHLIRWTKDEYFQLAEAGVFQGRRVELIEGEIIQMAPMGTPHFAGVTLANRVLSRAFGDEFFVAAPGILDLSRDTEPEADVAVLRMTAAEISANKPTKAELVIEVSDMSLRYDRNVKSRLYAKAGIADYWIVNLVDRVIEVRRDPEDNDYLKLDRYHPGDVIRPLAAPEISVAVDDLLPRLPDLD